eukprot:gene9230-10019_t
MASKLHFTTALVIIIPEEFHDMINRLRSQYDHAYPRWMPHMTLYYPFVSIEQFPEIANRLQTALRGFGNISINLNKISFFSQKGKSTLHLAPQDDTRLQELFQLIHQTIPEVPLARAQYKPHATIGQCDSGDRNQMMASFQEHFQHENMTMNICSIQLINRSETDKTIPFTIHSTVSLL